MESKQAPAVVLVRPTEAGNVGAVARAMANTGLDRLLLVEPAAPIDDVARARAVSGLSILESAVHFPSLELALAPFRTIIGTSSHRQRATRSRPITPRELPERLASVAWADTALVFGPERSGLTTEELAHCSEVVCIPTASTKPTLNLAQAVLVIAYELHVARTCKPLEDSEVTTAPATAENVGGLFRHVDELLHEVGFARDSTYEGVLLDLRRLAGRALLTDREVAILRGLCRRLEHALNRRANGS